MFQGENENPRNSCYLDQIYSTLTILIPYTTANTVQR